MNDLTFNQMKSCTIGSLAHVLKKNREAEAEKARQDKETIIANHKLIWKQVEIDNEI